MSKEGRGLGEKVNCLFENDEELFFFFFFWKIKEEEKRKRERIDKLRIERDCSFFIFNIENMGFQRRS